MEETPTTALNHDDDEISLLDIALVLAENWKALVFVPLAAGVTALGISFLVPPTYTAVTRILPPAQQQSTSAAIAAQLGALAGIVGPVTSIKNPVDQYVALIKSRSVYDAMIRRFGLKVLYDAVYIEEARKELDERTRVIAGARDGLITIEVDDADPERAAAMANGLVEELRNLIKTLAITEAAQRRLFFEEQLQQAKVSLTKAEIALQTSGVSTAALRTLPQSALESLARLKAQITAQEIKLASLRVFMTDTNPELKLAVRELAALREELAKAERSSSVKALNSGAEYIAKYRDFKYHEALFDLMAKQYELARIDEAREGVVIQVVDSAQPPERGSGPKKVFIALVVASVALVMAMLVVLARSAFQRMRRQPGTSEKLSRLAFLLRLRD